MLEIPDTPRGRRTLKKLQEPAKNRKVKEDLADIPGALEMLEKLRKEVDGLRKRVKLVESRTEKLWAEKVRRKIKEGQDVRKHTE